MDMDLIMEILKNNRALWVAATVTGIFAIIVSIVNAVFLIIQGRKQHKYNEQLEKFKHISEKKNYVSKVRFDTEFNIYKELSKTFFAMDACINTLIPAGLSYQSADEEIRKENDKTNFMNANNSIVDAQNCLYQNTPFIPEQFVSKYQELLELSKKQTSAFMQRWVVSNLNNDKADLGIEVYERSTEIHNKLMELNSEIRNYLSTLDVLD